MNDLERHRELKRLFLAASEMVGEDRKRWLDAECADSDLRREVEQLLGVTRDLGTRALQPDLPPDRFFTAPKDLELPCALGPYRLDEVLGRGGMGIVYGATDTRLDRRVALKQVPRQFASPAAEQAFRDEMKIVASLHHPNIALIFALEEWEGEPLAALERVPGETLAAMIARGPLDPSTMLPIAHQICRGLEVAHAAGIVHLDLKPANVMVTPEGQVKILDFGIARTLGTERSKSDLAGTPGYIAPELLRGTSVDPRADLYSFGVLWFEALTGKLPFRGATLEEWIACALEGDIPAEELPADLPPAVGEWVGRCLHRDPKERPNSIAEVRRRIDGWIAARHLDPEEPSPQPETSPLPHRFRSLIGRESLLEDLEEIWEAQPLVTVLGIGGGGKTRLALEAAHRAAEREVAVSWIDLAPVHEPASFLPWIASELGLETSTAQLNEEIERTLTHSPRRLVIDNCEHRLEELRPWLTRLLTRVPKVSILATSRAPLGLRAERTLPLPPLDLPSTDAAPEEIYAAEAPALFRRHARRHGQELTAEDAPRVASICQRLDGIPLALELAAARLRVLPLADLDRRLDDRFRVLTGGDAEAHPHQRTLRATLDWSDSLLDERQRALLRRLGVFADGFTLHAAEIVCADDALEGFEILDALAGLVDHSLVQVVEGAAPGELRYRLLASVREYAQEHFAADPQIAAFERKLLDATAEFFVPLESEFKGSGQIRWLRRLDQEQSNIERALEIATRGEQEAIRGIEILCAIWQGWELRLRAGLGLDWFDRLLPLAEPSLPKRLHAQALNSRGSLAEHIGDYDRVLPDFDRCLELCREAGWDSAVGVVLMNSAILIKARGDNREARRRYLEAKRLFEENQQEHSLMLVLTNLTVLDQQLGNYSEALAANRQALALAEKLEDRTAVASAYTQSGNVLRDDGRPEAGLEDHARALELYRELGDERGVALGLNNRALCRSDLGDHDGALADLLESLKIRRRDQDKRGTAITLLNLVSTSLALDRVEEARQLQDELFQLLLLLGEKRVAVHALEAAASYARAKHRWEDVVEIYGAVDALREEIAMPRTDQERVGRTEKLDLARQALDDPSPFEQRGRKRSFEEALEHARAAAAERPEGA